MTLRDTYFSPLFLVKFMVSLCKLISVLNVVPEVWFDVDGNSGDTRKIYLYMSRTCQKI